jgi:hypothetical protein
MGYGFRAVNSRLAALVPDREGLDHLFEHNFFELKKGLFSAPSRLTAFRFGGTNDCNLAWTNGSPWPARHDGHNRRDQIWSLDEQ